MHFGKRVVRLVSRFNYLTRHQERVTLGTCQTFRKVHKMKWNIEAFINWLKQTKCVDIMLVCKYWSAVLFLLYLKFGAVWNQEHLNRQIYIYTCKCLAIFSFKAWIYILNRNNAYILKGLNEAQIWLKRTYYGITDWYWSLKILSVIEVSGTQKRESVTGVKKKKNNKCFKRNCTQCNEKFQQQNNSGRLGKVTPSICLFHEINECACIKGASFYRIFARKKPLFGWYVRKVTALLVYSSVWHPSME